MHCFPVNPITISQSRLCAGVNTSHTANMANMLPFPHGQTREFALGLLMFVTALSKPLSLIATEFSIQISNDDTVELNRSTSSKERNLICFFL